MDHGVLSKKYNLGRGGHHESGHHGVRHLPRGCLAVAVLAIGMAIDLCRRHDRVELGNAPGRVMWWAVSRGVCEEFGWSRVVESVVAN